MTEEREMIEKKKKGKKLKIKCEKNLYKQKLAQIFNPSDLITIR
jgi:hypothetical protein